MATKTYRAIYLSPELDERIVKKAQEEKLSASKLIRDAVEKYLAGKNKKMVERNFTENTNCIYGG